MKEYEPGINFTLSLMASLEDPNHPSYREDEWERWEALKTNLDDVLMILKQSEYKHENPDKT